MTLDSRAVARALGGEIVGGSVVCPGPGHSRGDRSLSVRPSEESPDGFVCHWFAGDPWQECRDYIRSRLGLPAWATSRLSADGAKSWRRTQAVIYASGHGGVARMGTHGLQRPRKRLAKQNAAASSLSIFGLALAALIGL
jgi:hypothetical protein